LASHKPKAMLSYTKELRWRFDIFGSSPYRRLGLSSSLMPKVAMKSAKSKVSKALKAKQKLSKVKAKSKASKSKPEGSWAKPKDKPEPKNRNGAAKAKAELPKLNNINTEKSQPELREVIRNQKTIFTNLCAFVS
jgi:hypothetical protein